MALLIAARLGFVRDLVLPELEFQGISNGDKNRIKNEISYDGSSEDPEIAERLRKIARAKEENPYFFIRMKEDNGTTTCAFKRRCDKTCSHMLQNAPAVRSLAGEYVLEMGLLKFYNDGGFDLPVDSTADFLSGGYDSSKRLSYVRMTGRFYRNSVFYSYTETIPEMTYARFAEKSEGYSITRESIAMQDSDRGTKFTSAIGTLIVVHSTEQDNA